MTRVLVWIESEIDAWNIPGAQVQRLLDGATRDHGVDISHIVGADRMHEELPTADVAFAAFFPESMLRAATRLRWLHCSSAGVGRLLFPAMVASPIVITNARGLQARPMAEHVIGAAIALARRFPLAMRRQVARQWAQEELGFDSGAGTIAGKRLGVIGLGAVGAEVARLARAMGMSVSAIRRRPGAPAPEGIDRVYGLDGLHTLLAESDVVVLAAPLTAHTRGLIDAAALRRMKRDAVIINVGRGRLVDESALARALAEGVIAGAALDVFEKEPLPADSPLWDMENVLITPHSSFVRPGYWDAQVDLFLDNLGRFARSEPLLNVVDKQAGY